MTCATTVARERAIPAPPTASSSPRALYDKALREYQSYRGDALATIDEALRRDPDFVRGHLLRAIVLGTFAERRFAEQARVSVVSAEALARRATKTELGLTRAARCLVDGWWAHACRTLDAVLTEDPLDALAVQAAHLLDFYRGDTLNLRNRIARVLPEWSKEVPGYSYVLGMYAFGLEENHEYARAEETALRALALEEDDAWAIHAVAHVMEMQGRVDEGITWLRSREPTWGPGNGFAFHNHWHLALFLLERARTEEVIAHYDRNVRPAVPDRASSLELVDATALLFRLFLAGSEVEARAKELASAWAQRLDVERGFYAFNDLHAMMAFTMAGAEPEAKALGADLEWTAANATGDNRKMSRDVGLHASLAVWAFGRGRYDETIALLEPIRDVSSGFGGSHAQRDVLTQTLCAAARRAGRTKLAARYAAERKEQRVIESAVAHVSPLVLRRVAVGDGVELEYAERGIGPAIVFLHGYTDSWRSFEDTLARLPPGLRGVALTLRGHGNSDRPGAGYRIEDFAHDVIAVLDALGLAKVTLVGHSMGSLVAQEVAVAHPSRLAGLVLVGSQTSFDQPPVRALQAALASFDGAVPRAFVTEFQASTVHHPLPLRFLERIVDESLKVPAHVWRAALDGTLAFGLGERLREIHVPTLIAFGNHDVFATADEQEKLHALIGTSSLSRYEGVAHCPHWEMPKRFVDELVAFVLRPGAHSYSPGELLQTR